MLDATASDTLIVIRFESGDVSSSSDFIPKDKVFNMDTNEWQWAWQQD